MRGVWISLLALVLAATVQAEDFKGQKVTLGKKKCTCDFTLDMKTKCKGSAKCDKRCTGKGTVEVGGCSFSLLVKKGGKGTISKCACAAQPTEAPAPAPTGTGSGSGETPVPITGSGSGGSGSGAPPAGGEGMQCACKCDCPDGAGECDCDCNCPMTSKAVTCSPGFSKVCPMTDGQCPMDMEMMCPKGAMSRMASGGQGSDKGCQCVPDFLISLVMPSAAGRSLDRASGKVNIKIGKKTCKCSYGIVEANCKKSKFTCDKKCSGKATGVELEDGMYVMDLIIRKGKVTIAKCDKEEGPAPTGPGTGGSGNGGEGSGSGNGGEGTGASRCACVSKGMGGTGPSPPTGSGSGSGPAPPTGSGSGSGPAPPTGSGSGSEPGSGSGSVDSVWGEWGSWSLCEEGKQKRTRQCNNLAPLSGVASCPGDSEEEVSCTERPLNFGPAISVDVSTWEKFLAAYNQTYEAFLPGSDLKVRQDIYEENKQRVDQHNKLFEKGLVDYPLKLNEFSALTYEEFVQSHTGFTNVIENRQVNNESSFDSVSPNNLPEEFDWTNYGAVTPVKNQAYKLRIRCNSCWAFSATATVESQNYLNTKILRPLSEQQMLDCTYNVSVHDGCKNGLVSDAWNTVLDGMYLDSNYPYVARVEECKTEETEKFQKLTGSGYEWVLNDTDIIKANLIARGPLSVAYFADGNVFKLWDWTKKPIFTSTENCTSTKANHAVLLVGYGVENGVPYWRMKNSWSPSWGERGYFRIKRGENICAVENYVAFPKTKGREGCSIYPGKQANGTVIVGGERGNSSLQACADWCQESKNCSVWQFDMVNKHCFLKSPNDGFSCPETGCSDSKNISGTSSCGIKQLRTYGGPSIPVVFQKSEEFNITKGNKLTELSVQGRQYIITFQLFITAPTNSGYTNIIHLGMMGKYGDRTLGIWIWNRRRLTVRSAINGNHDYNMTTSSYQLSLDTWHSIEVSQLAFENEVYFTFKVDGTTFGDVKNKDAQEFRNVTIYAGDPWEIPSSAKIRNLEIKTMS